MDGARFDTATSVMTGGRRPILAMAAALAFGGAIRGMASPPVARAAKRKRAYHCPLSPDLSYVFVDGNQRLAQRFAATRSGSLRQIKIAIHKPSGTSGDYVVQLVKVTGSPNGTPSESPLDVLAAVTIADATVPTGVSTLTAKFAGTTLEKGTEYAAVISRPESGVQDLAVAFWLDPSGDACPGLWYGADEGDPFIPSPDLDMVLTVLVA